MEKTELGALAARYLEQKRITRSMNVKSRKNAWQALGPLVETYGHRPVRRMGQSDIERWLRSRGHLAPSTLAVHFGLVHAFLNWLVANGHLALNPARTMDKPKRPVRVPRALDHPSVGRILEAAPDARAEAMVELMVGSALRAGEVAAADIDRWDRRRCMLTIVGKGNKERTVPVPRTTELAIDRYLLEHPAASGPMFRSYVTGRRLSPHTVSIYTSKWCRDAGVKRYAFDGVSAHALRHTCATDVLEGCLDLRVVQQLLGHDHLSSTERYLKGASMEELRRAVEGRDYRRPGGPAGTHPPKQRLARRRPPIRRR